MTNKQLLTNALKENFGFDTFKGNQEAIMLSLLDGDDVFVLMPTGGGKSLCYQLPSLIMEGTAIVISPLIALMKNQVDAMRNFSADDGVAHFLNSSLSRAAVDQVKSDVTAGKTKLLYVAPESLTKEENIEFLKTVPISFYAVDEAHCISEWGHDFRPEYRRIRPIINEIAPRPVIALTATATPKVQHDIQKNLGMTEAKVFRSSFNRPNLYYEIRPKTSNVDKDIIRFIKSHSGKSGIIYCLSRKKVEELTELLKVNNIKVLPYHAGMDSATRSENQDAFLLEKVDVIVATIAFGMGIDKPDVRTVVHYDLPSSLEEYYQEAGRAGRDGRESFAVVITSPRDKATLSRRLSESFPDKEFIRHIYELAGNFLGVAVGEGYGMLYEFNFDLFCRTYSLPPAPTRSALTLLSRAGYFEYIDETTSRSRLMVIMRKDQLYDLELTPDAEEVFQCVLRNYTGLFADYVYISELVIARSTCLSSERVYQALLYLGRIHAVHYVPRRTTPYIYYSTSRELPKHVIMPLEVYERQCERMALRLEAMKSFAFNTSECRVRGMLRYFGESDAQDCGKCDVCRSRRKSADTPETTRSLRESIVYQASREGGCSVETIISNCQGPREQTIQTIRDLADKGIVRIDGHTVIAAKIQ